MISRSVKYAWQHIRYIPLWSALTYSRWRGFDARARSLGNSFGWVMRWIPIARRRFDREVLRIFPDMARAERLALSRKMGQNMGRTLFEVFHNAEFQTRQDHFHISRPGLEVLEQARDAGKGAIIVSGTLASGKRCAQCLSIVAWKPPGSTAANITAITNACWCAE